jgi:hypothetical protein
MPDTRSHRGAHPEDAGLFAAAHWPALRVATQEICWLLDRGYALRSALALVGDRHRLVQRQRLAIARCACSAEQRDRRSAHRVEPTALADRELWIDGYNLLITVESALAGGVILLGRDGCCRDMASVHGTYREVAETMCAAELIGMAAATWKIAKCRWLLDRPVGNSGRLKATLDHVAERFGWRWAVSLETNPDRMLGDTSAIVASSDSVVLDRCDRWCDVAREIVMRSTPEAFVVDLRPSV